MVLSLSPRSTRRYVPVRTAPTRRSRPSAVAPTARLPVTEAGTLIPTLHRGRPTYLTYEIQACIMAHHRQPRRLQSKRPRRRTRKKDEDEEERRRAKSLVTKWSTTTSAPAK